MKEAWFYCGRNTLKKEEQGACLAVQRLRLGASAAGGPGSTLWGSKVARAAEPNQRRKGGASTNPEPRSPDAKSTVLANTARCRGFSSGVSTRRHHLAGRWEHPGERRDSPPPCKPGSSLRTTLRVPSGKIRLLQGSHAASQYSHIHIILTFFQNGNYVVLMIDLLKWMFICKDSYTQRYIVETEVYL